MKKYLLLLGLLLLLTGCGDKYITCTINLKNDGYGYIQDSIYKIYYKGNYVKTIKKTDIYKSDIKETLKYFDEYKALEYSNFKNKYGGIDYTIKSDNSKVLAQSTFDLNSINIKLIRSDKYIDRDYIINNKLTVTGIKHYYSAKGAECR